MSYHVKKPLKQVPTFVNRTYKGGKLMQQFLRLANEKEAADTLISGGLDFIIYRGEKSALH